MLDELKIRLATLERVVDAQPNITIEELKVLSIKILNLERLPENGYKFLSNDVTVSINKIRELLSYIRFMERLFVIKVDDGGGD